MPDLSTIRTSLEVGFRDGAAPAGVWRPRGKDFRAIDAVEAFPYEDAQFEAVTLAAGAVSLARVKEAHRVLKADGWLFFTVPEKTAKQAGFTLPEVYSLLRSGFNILQVVRPAWWWFGRRGRTISIAAKKKYWRAHTNTYRPLA